MTEKELSKLKRVELLELMTALRKRYDEALDEIESLKAQLEEERSSRSERIYGMVKALYEDRFGTPHEEHESHGSDEK